MTLNLANNPGNSTLGGTRTVAAVNGVATFSDLTLNNPGNGYVLINSRRSFEQLGLADIVQRYQSDRLTTVPATEIAMKHLGRPLPNVALIGGFAALSALVSMDAVAHAIRDKFSGKVAEANIAAAAEAYAYVRREIEELQRC